MSLRKRGAVWWVYVIAPDGERIRRTTGTANKALAQEFHDKLKTELWRISKLGEKPRRTWNDAVVRWLKEASHKASIQADKIHLRWLDAHFGGKHLDAITRGSIDRITDVKLADLIRFQHRVEPAEEFIAQIARTESRSALAHEKSALIECIRMTMAEF